MRWLLLLVGLLLLAPGSVGALDSDLLPLRPAAPPDTLAARFEAATGAYAQGRYARAVDGYEAVLASGYTTGALYYNLGNAYVRLGRLGPAIRYYEKARRLRPDDPRVRHNLEQARRRAGVYPERLDDAPPRGLRGLVRDWSPLALLLGGILLFASGLAVAVAWTRPDRTRLRHPLVWGPIGAGLLLVGTALGTSYLQSLTQRAVVLADRAAVHRSPTPDAPSDTTLSEGVLVEVRARSSGWHAIRLADGTAGWVPAEALGGI